MLLDIFDKTNVFVASFHSTVPMPFVVLQAYMSAAFPASTLDILYTCNGEPYPAETTTHMQKVSLSVTVEQLGPREFPDSRMNRSRNTSPAQSPLLSPSVSTLSRPVSPALSATRSNLQQSISNIRGAGLQAALRDCCLRRDQFCVVTGETDEAVLKCCHVLTIEYARDFLAGFVGGSAPLAGVPTVANRYQREMDVRCAIMMTSDLHELYDNFRFSILPQNGQLFIWCFKPCAVQTGTIVQRPRLVPVGYDPTYFQRQFPADELFMQHFKQAVLRNMVGAGDNADDRFEPDTESSVAVEEGDLRWSLRTLTDCLIPEEGDTEDILVAKLNLLDSVQTEMSPSPLII